MEITKHNDQAHDIHLLPSEVESACMMFIAACHPEYSKDWLLNAKYNLGAVIMAGTKS